MSTELYRRYIEAGDNDLMRQVWSGTPWMVSAYTGQGDRDRHSEIRLWCFDTHGPEAFPFGDKPRLGVWREGNATVFGWTWYGFATEALMRQFQARWPDPEDEPPMTPTRQDERTG